MNIADTTQFKETLDAVLQAATEYGDQSKQLAKARDDLKDYIMAANALNQKLEDVVRKSEIFVSFLSKTLESDFTEKIKKDVSKTTDILNRCQKQSEALTGQYEALINSFHEHKDLLNKQQDQYMAFCKTSFSGLSEALVSAESHLSAMSESGQKVTMDVLKKEEQTITSIVESIKGATETARTYAQQLESSYQQHVTALGVELTEKLSVAQKTLKAESDALKQSNEQLLRECETIKIQQSDVKNSLAQITGIIENIRNQSERTGKVVDEINDRLKRINDQIETHSTNETKENADIREALKKQSIFVAIGFLVLAVITLLKFFI